MRKFVKNFFGSSRKTPAEPIIHGDRKNPSTTDSIRKLGNLGVYFDVVVDVGVMYGTSKLIQALPKAHHYLIESISDFYPEISKNYSQVRHSIVPFGASNKNGLQDIVVERNPGGLIQYSHMLDGTTSAKDSRTVEMLTLDYISDVYDIQGKILIKIDVDGDELKVLEGGPNLLKKANLLILEVTTDSFYERVHFMSTVGYRLFDIVDICYYKGRLHQMDLIFIRSDYYLQMELNPWSSGDFDATQFEEL
jgi:FkbM family methyltransferase